MKWTSVMPACLVIMFVAGSALAQDCTPVAIYGKVGWSNDSAQNLPPDASASWQVQQDTNIAHIFSSAVPAGQVWRLRTISLSTGYGGNAEYMVEHLVNVPNGYHYHAIARGSAGATPALAVSSADLRADIFVAGERIGWRTSGPGPIFGMWSGWAFPASCLPRLLGVDTPVITTTTGAPPDFSALLQAAQNAAAALTTLSQSAP